MRSRWTSTWPFEDVELLTTGTPLPHGFDGALISSSAFPDVFFIPQSSSPTQPGVRYPSIHGPKELPGLPYSMVKGRLGDYQD